MVLVEVWTTFSSIDVRCEKCDLCGKKKGIEKRMNE